MKRNNYFKVESGTRYFEAVGNIMNDGSSSSIIPGDLLKVKDSDLHPTKTKRKGLKQKFSNIEEIELLIKLGDIHLVGLFSNYDEHTNTLQCRFLNPDKNTYPDLKIKVNLISQIYKIESLQRTIDPFFR